MRTSAKDRIRSLVAEMLKTQDPVHVQIIGAKLQAEIRQLVDELRVRAASDGQGNWHGEPSL
jgi:hypothetical protein